jgi:hypothetical protein
MVREALLEDHAGVQRRLDPFGIASWIVLPTDFHASVVKSVERTLRVADSWVSAGAAAISAPRRMPLAIASAVLIFRG